MQATDGFVDLRPEAVNGGDIGHVTTGPAKGFDVFPPNVNQSRFDLGQLFRI